MQEDLLRFVLALVIGLMVVASLDGLSSALPPRPEPRTQPTQGSEASHGNASDGAVLLLRVQFPPTWNWEQTHWQELWTGVQWLNPSTGIWNDVDGWQGKLDGLTNEEDHTLVGQKAWWVMKPHLGTGPFRWIVYDGQGGPPLATSDPFQLPEMVDQTRSVNVSLPSNQ
jgi:hypothetical protein